MANQHQSELHPSRPSIKHYGWQAICQWNPEFTERRNLPLFTENQAIVEQIQKLDSVGGDSVIKLFMNVGDEPLSPQAQLLVGICEKNARNKSLPSLVEESKEKVALLDDRDGTGRPRPDNIHAFTPRQLLETLQKPVKYSQILI